MVKYFNHCYVMKVVCSLQLTYFVILIALTYYEEVFLRILANHHLGSPSKSASRKEMKTFSSLKMS